jgi:predicted transcriptional regulator
MPLSAAMSQPATLSGMPGSPPWRNPIRNNEQDTLCALMRTKVQTLLRTDSAGYSSDVNRLGELERAIMDILWESPDPLTVRQVSGGLTERDLAHTTVMTVLDRLAKKGFARRDRNGRAWRYHAAATREAYVTELMLSALEQTGDRQAALARFARSVSETEATALRRALEALGRGKDALRATGE